MRTLYIKVNKRQVDSCFYMHSRLFAASYPTKTTNLLKMVWCRSIKRYTRSWKPNSWKTSSRRRSSNIPDRPLLPPCITPSQFRRTHHPTRSTPKSKSRFTPRLRIQHAEDTQHQQRLCHPFLTKFGHHNTQHQRLCQDQHKHKTPFPNNTQHQRL